MYVSCTCAFMLIWCMFGPPTCTLTDVITNIKLVIKTLTPVSVSVSVNVNRHPRKFRERPHWCLNNSKTTMQIYVPLFKYLLVVQYYAMPCNTCIWYEFQVIWNHMMGFKRNFASFAWVKRELRCKDQFSSSIGPGMSLKSYEIIWWELHASFVSYA